MKVTYIVGRQGKDNYWAGDGIGTSKLQEAKKFSSKEDLIKDINEWYGPHWSRLLEIFEVTTIEKL